MVKTLIYRLSLDVYGIPENDPGEALGAFIEDLANANARFDWDTVSWQRVGEEVTE